MIDISDQEFRRLAEYIRIHFGIQLNQEKKLLAVGRLNQVLQNLNISTFSEYMNYLAADRSGEAAKIFIDKMTTNHTFFMRESDHFQYFKDRILPELLPRLTHRDLRIWSAGCSTGQEPYTLAMLIHEYLGFEKVGWDTKVLATDISEQVLRQASRGIYDSKAVAPLPHSWRQAYFQPYGNAEYEVVSRIRNEVIYRRFNLMDKFPFKKKFHVIFCRNVMIYFDAKTKMELIQKFYDSLEPRGYLFIGHSETIHRDFLKLKYVMPAVYRKEE